MKTARRQTRELASRCHIRHALAVERAKGVVSQVGSTFDALAMKVAALLDSRGDAARAIDIIAREMPDMLERVFEQHARWSWRRSVEVWSGVLTRRQAERLAKRRALIREDDDDRMADLGEIDADGEKIAVFKPPRRSTIQRWIDNPGWYAGSSKGWRERFADYSKKIADPEQMRSTIARMFAAGESPKAIRNAIMPIVGNLKASAQRIARTETLRIAEEAQRATYAQVDDLVGGIQIWATLDDRTRPEHAMRSGTIYAKDAAPLVPDEPNCRCFSSPVLRDDAEIIKADVSGRPIAGLTIVNGTVHDLDTWASWFDDQTPARQRAIIGPERWEAITSKIDGRVRWKSLVSQDGYMDSPEQIRSAPAEVLAARVTTRGEPSDMPHAIADTIEVPKLEPRPDSELVTVLAGRERGGGEPIGIPVADMTPAVLQREQAADVPVKLAGPKTNGVPGDRLPPAVANAFIRVEATPQGQRAAAMLGRLSPRVLQTRAGAERMLGILGLPGVRASDQVRQFWAERVGARAESRA